MITRTFVFTACLMLFLSPVFSSVYYVATNGSDAGNGTKSKPYLTIQKAQETVVPGDTVYVRGGTYVMTEAQIASSAGLWAYVTHITKSGTPGKPINYWAYPTEKPVFDYSQVKPANHRISAFWVSASWIHFKGLEVTGVQVTIKTHTQSECFSNSGNHNIYEILSMHDGQAIGFFLREGADNLVLNCDAYRNYDYTSEGGKGGNTDGFGCHPAKGGTNNVLRGCRAWFNSDDGYDCINSAEPVIFENCWAFYNGYSSSFKSLADGNGFKAGGYAYRPPANVPNPVPRNTVRFCLSVNNKANGFYANHHREGSDWYNNTAYLNANNYNMLNRLIDNTSDVPGYNHKMRNNLGFAARNAEVANIDSSKSDIKNNYFNLPVKVKATDFLSVDTALLTAPRQAGGSLPNNNFMKLKPSSNLIDKGEKIGFSYNGSAPDLGCFESNGSTRK
jgi:hypothetical protein